VIFDLGSSNKTHWVWGQVSQPLELHYYYYY